MKTLQKYVDDSIKDAKMVLPALEDAGKRLSAKYEESTHPKLRILDNLIILSLATFVSRASIPQGPSALAVRRAARQNRIT